MVEVYTTRETQNPGSPGATAWQPREPDPELEAEYLRRLMVRLGAQEEKARTLMANAGVPAQQNPQGPQARQSERAQIRKGVDGLEALEVAEPFDRVWRRVGLALDRGGFTVEDRDRQKGIYFVRYADPEADVNKPGFFDKLFGTSRKLTTQQYQVRVSEAGTASRVNVLNKDGAPVDSKSAQRILALLHDQLK
jgi:outer membrane protein assembly factor BamC